MAQIQFSLIKQIKSELPEHPLTPHLPTSNSISFLPTSNSISFLPYLILVPQRRLVLIVFQWWFRITEHEVMLAELFDIFLKECYFLDC